MSCGLTLSIRRDAPMVKLSKGTQQLLMRLQSTGDEESGNGQLQTRENYFLDAAARNAYLTSPEPHKKYTALIERERKFRYMLTMETMGFIDKAKAIFSYYWSGKEKGIPSMSMILKRNLEEIMDTTSKLEGILTNVSAKQSDVDRYYDQVIDEIERSTVAMRFAERERGDCKMAIGELDRVIAETDDIHAQCQLMKQRYHALVGYRKNTVDWVENGYRRDLCKQQIIDLEGVGAFVNAMDVSSKLTLVFSNKLAEHFEKVRYVYDILPDVLKKEISLEKSQKKLSDRITDYKDILAELYTLNVEKVRSVMDHDKASKLIGDDIYHNIQALKSMPGS
jgi:hypothetical protein